MLGGGGGGGMILRGGAGGSLDLAAAMEGVELDEELAAGFERFGVVGLILDEGRGCAAGLLIPDFLCKKTFVGTTKMFGKGDTYLRPACFEQFALRNGTNNAWLSLRYWSRLARRWLSRRNMNHVALVNITARNSFVFDEFNLCLLIFLLNIINTK